MKRVEQVVREIRVGRRGRRHDPQPRRRDHLRASATRSASTAAGSTSGDGEYYELKATFPDARPAEREIRVPASYAPIEIALTEGVVYMDSERSAPRPQARGPARASSASRRSRSATRSSSCRSTSRPGVHRDDVLFSLGVLRHGINQRLRQERMEEVFDQARKIQASILPRRVPVYGGFELYGRIQPMESVGGDFYDFIPITDKILGLAIADVSGPRPAGGAPGARHLHGAAHGDGARLQDRAHGRAPEPDHPPVDADQPLRLDVLRRARAERRLHLRQRRPPAAVPPLGRGRSALPRRGRRGARAARRRHLRARLRAPRSRATCWCSTPTA